ncbi:hypothetical protein MMC25_001838 [Agyrium rufum]|nr:hypothetical protein [Agyrium rufum]
MDPASAVAGLIGLGALVFQTTQSTLELVKDLKGASRRRDNLLDWTAKLEGALSGLNKCREEAAGTLLNIDIGELRNRIEECLGDCRAKCESLRALIEAQGKGRLASMKTALNSAEIDNKIRDLERSFQALSQRRMDLLGTISTSTYTVVKQTQIQVEKITQSSNETRQLFETVSRQGIQELGLMQHKIERIGETSVQTQLMVKQFNEDLRIQTLQLVASLVTQRQLEQSSFRTSPRLISRRKINLTARRTHQEDIDPGLSESFDVDEGNASSFDPTTKRRTCCVDASQKTLWKWNGEVLFNKVSLVARNKRRLRRVANCEVEEEQVEIDIRLRSTISSSCVWQASLLFDVQQGLSLPTHLSLSFPRIVQESDPGIQCIKDGNVNGLIFALRDRRLLPTDIIHEPRRGYYLPRPDLGLIEFACYYQQLEIMKILLQCGAKPDYCMPAMKIHSQPHRIWDQKLNQSDLRNYVDITRVLVEADAEHDYPLGLSISTNHLDWTPDRKQICMQYTGEIYKIVWGPHEHSASINGMMDEAGFELNTLDIFLYSGFSSCSQGSLKDYDPWGYQHLDLAWSLGARLDTPRPEGDKSLQNFIRIIGFNHILMLDYDETMDEQITNFKSPLVYHSILWLLRHGADPLAVDMNGETAAWLASSHGWLPELTKALCATGYSINTIARRAVTAITPHFLHTLRKRSESVKADPYKTPILVPDSPDEARDLLLLDFSWCGFDITLDHDDCFTTKHATHASMIDFDPNTIAKPSEHIPVRRRAYYNDQTT